MINAKDLEKLYEPIKSDLKEKFEDYLVNIDSEFCKDNYKWVLSNVESENIQKIYKILGPVDFYIKKDHELKDFVE